MTRLRPSQLELLAYHRERALDVLLTTSAAYDGRERLRATPEGATLLSQPPDLLASVGISAAAAAIERRRLLQERAGAQGVIQLEAVDAFLPEVLRALKRRRLPFTSADVVLLLDLGTSAMTAERAVAQAFEALSFAVAAASDLLRVEPASAAVIAALDRAGEALDGLGHASASEAGELRRRIHALVAAHVPGGLLDLSVLDSRDAWAKVAENVLRAHAERWDGVQRLIALVARARTTRPTAAWSREASALARTYDDLPQLLRELLEPIPTIDLSTSGLEWPPGWLLAPGNETLARGATWATAAVDEPWVVPLLGRLALRGAAPAPHPTVTIALSHRLASGAIETLAGIGTAEAHAELRTLLAEIRRRDLLKRIAAIVGEATPETRARDDRIRREKARAVRQKSDPEPRQRQRLATQRVRRDLAPLLRGAGFDDAAGRTFWRDLDDRVETLHCKAHSGGLTLELGIWFRFVPRLARTAEPAVPRPATHACDLRGNVHTSYDGLASAGAAAERWFARWRPLPAVLRWLLVGRVSDHVFGPGIRDSPTHALLTGYVARELGEETVARKRLATAATHFRESLDAADEGAPERERWVERLEADAAR